MLSIRNRSVHLLAMMIMTVTLSGCSISGLFGIDFGKKDNGIEVPTGEGPGGNTGNNGSEEIPIEVPNNSSGDNGKQNPGGSSTEPTQDKPSDGVAGSALPGVIPPTVSGRMSGLFIAIDAGHGGKLGEGSNVLGNTGWLGQSSPEDGIYEKHITLGVALRVAELAKREGAQVYLTREGDYAVVNKNRASAANTWAQAKGATAANYVLVSIHTNSRGTTLTDGTIKYDSDMQGTQVIWPLSHAVTGARTDGSDRFANILKEEFTQHMGTYDRSGWGQNLDVLYYSDYPSALLELMFQSNKAEEQRLLNYSEQWRMAEAILKGLRRWWGR